jgi:hypothetical protein
MFSFLKRSRKPSPASRRSSARRFRPTFEALEDRELLSATQSILSNGQLFTLDNHSELWQQNVSTGVIREIDGPNLAGGQAVQSFAVDPVHSALYYLEAGGYLWRQDLSWSAGPSASGAFGAGSSFQMAPDGTVYLLDGAGSNLYRSVPGQAREQVGAFGAGSSFQMAPDGTVYVLASADGSVYRFAPGQSARQQTGTSGVLTSDGSIWFLGTSAVDGAGDYAIYQLSNGQVNSVCLTSAAIGNQWLGMGGPSSALGLPTGNSFTTSDTGVAQHFQNGGLYYAPWTGPRVLTGPIWNAYLAQGAESSPLGLPVSAAPFTTSDNGTAVHFHHGGIYYAPWTGPRVLTGPIWDAYLAQGAESSPLGLPVSAAPAVTPSGSVVQFQNGTMYWTPGTGVDVVMGQGSAVAADGSLKSAVANALDEIQTNAQYLQGYYDTLNSGGTVELKDTKLGQFLQQSLNLFAVGNQGTVTLESFSVHGVPYILGLHDLEVHIVISDRVHHDWGNGLGIDVRNRLDVTAKLGQLCQAIVEAATGDEPMAWINLVNASHTKHDVQLPNGQWFTILDTDWFKPVAQIWSYWHDFGNLWDTVTSYL